MEIGRPENQGCEGGSGAEQLVGSVKPQAKGFGGNTARGIIDLSCLNHLEQLVWRTMSVLATTVQTVYVTTNDNWISLLDTIKPKISWLKPFGLAIASWSVKVCVNVLNVT